MTLEDTKFVRALCLVDCTYDDVGLSLHVDSHVAVEIYLGNR
jgi:hypothetical protein